MWLSKLSVKENDVTNILWKFLKSNYFHVHGAWKIDFQHLCSLEIIVAQIIFKVSFTYALTTFVTLKYQLDLFEFLLLKGYTYIFMNK